MIERYSHPEIRQVWDQQNRLQHWVRVEAAIALAGGFDELHQTLREFVADAYFVERVNRAEKVTGHEVTAFLNTLEHSLKTTPEINRLHWGATSSDLMDTELALAVRQVNLLLVDEITRLIGTLELHLLITNQPHRLARTHGQVVYPTEVSHTIKTLWAELSRTRHNMNVAAVDVRGRIAGPAGDHPILNQRDEYVGLKWLGLQRETWTLQMSPRDRLIGWLHALSRLATMIEKIATLVRFESIQGVDGVVLKQPPGYHGSSSMPHKNNPTRAERLCGLAHLVRANIRAVEDVSVPWGDHSLEHSSVERVVLPMVTELLGFMLAEARVILHQVTWVDQVKTAAGLVIPTESFRALHALLQDNPNMRRSEAYDLIKEGN
jgi:adenylosuccinate lyase